MNFVNEPLAISHHRHKKTTVIIFTVAMLILIGVFLVIQHSQSMVISDGEPSAVKSISTIQTLQAQYASQNQGNFAVNFDELIE